MQHSTHYALSLCALTLLSSTVFAAAPDEYAASGDNTIKNIQIRSSTADTEKK